MLERKRVVQTPWLPTCSPVTPATLLPKTVTPVSRKSAIRDMLVSRGIYPEQLPPAEDVKKVEQRLAKDTQKAKISNKNKI